MTDKVCPVLGTGSVDGNALQDAMKKKDADLDKALADATTIGVAGRVKAEPAAAPAPDTKSAPEAPSAG